MMYFPPTKKVNTLRYKLRLTCLPSRSFAWSISILSAKIIFGNFVVSTIITTILLVFVHDTVDHHSIWTLIWAGFLGVASVILIMIQYIPQIIETYLRKVWRLKRANRGAIRSNDLSLMTDTPITTFLPPSPHFQSVGALSTSMMVMQTPGAILMTISLALSPGANWSTWVPYAVAAFFQLVLLGMCLYYRFHTKRLGLSSFHTAETTPLLAGKGSQKLGPYGTDRGGQALGVLDSKANSRISTAL